MLLECDVYTAQYTFRGMLITDCEQKPKIKYESNLLLEHVPGGALVSCDSLCVLYLIVCKYKELSMVPRRLLMTV